MRIVVRDGTVRCGHDGVVALTASQPWVRVGGSPVLVEPDPVGRSISLCPNVSATIKPCTATLAVHEGYSTFVRVAGHPVCLDTVVGYTDGTPPGAVDYTVRDPGQRLVGVTA